MQETFCGTQAQAAQPQAAGWGSSARRSLWPWLLPPAPQPWALRFQQQAAAAKMAKAAGAAQHPAVLSLVPVLLLLLLLLLLSPLRQLTVSHQ